MSGGVANNKGLVFLLEQKLEASLTIPEHPQIMGAFGQGLRPVKADKPGSIERSTVRRRHLVP